MASPAGIRETGFVPSRERERFERDGYVIIRGALSAAEVSRYARALDQVYAWAAPHELGPGGSLHRLSAVASCPTAAGLLNHPRTFRYVWSVLGWNIHVYHSHIDVHPPLRERRPFRFEWHQDGGRQNREIETSPRPRLSVKLAYWLSDVSVPGRGNMKVVPGSHLINWIDGPPRRDHPHPDPPGATEVTVRAGDAVMFDRRLWHARSDNYSGVTRKVIFLGYTYRWIAIRDDLRGVRGAGWLGELDPVQRQLLGLSAGDGDHAWGHSPRATPLYGYLLERGLLDPGYPPLRP